MRRGSDPNQSTYTHAHMHTDMILPHVQTNTSSTLSESRQARIRRRTWPGVASFSPPSSKPTSSWPWRKRTGRRRTSPHGGSSTALSSSVGARTSISPFVTVRVPVDWCDRVGARSVVSHDGTRTHVWSLYSRFSFLFLSDHLRLYFFFCCCCCFRPLIFVHHACHSDGPTVTSCTFPVHFLLRPFSFFLSSPFFTSSTAFIFFVVHHPGSSLLSSSSSCLLSPSCRVALRPWAEADVGLYTDGRFMVAQLVARVFLSHLQSLGATRADRLLRFMSATRSTGVFELLQPEYQHVVVLQPPATLCFIAWSPSSIEATRSLCSVNPAFGIELARNLGLASVRYTLVQPSDTDRFVSL